MRSRRLLPVLVLATVVCACATGDYGRARALDLADCFTLTVRAGPELSAGVQATDGLHLLVGGGLHAEAGMVGRRLGTAEVITMGLPIVPFLEDGVLHGRFAVDNPGGAWRVEDVQDECYVVHAGGWAPTNPDSSWLHGFDLEVSATLLVGARVGFSPGELVDFLAGLFGGDPAGDDA